MYRMLMVVLIANVSYLFSGKTREGWICCWEGVEFEYCLRREEKLNLHFPNNTDLCWQVGVTQHEEPTQWIPMSNQWSRECDSVENHLSHWLLPFAWSCTIKFPRIRFTSLRMIKTAEQAVLLVVLACSCSCCCLFLDVLVVLVVLVLVPVPVAVLVVVLVAVVVLVGRDGGWSPV